MVLGDPYQLEFVLMQMLLKLNAESLQCAYGRIKMDVPRSKKGNQHLLFKNLVRHLSSEEGEAREYGAL